MQITVIMNSSAGQGAHEPDELCRVIEGAGHRVTLRQPNDHDLPQALGQVGDLVVAAGGDGTVGRVMKALAGRGVPLAILPLGTANNIAASLGIRGTPSDLVPGWSRDGRRRVDIGLVRGPWGTTPFVESVGIGLLAHLIRPEVGDELENVDAARAAARRLARTLPALDRQVELDGRNISAPYLLLEAMNIRCAGPNLWLAKEAQPGDRQLEVVMAKDVDRTALIALADASSGANSRLSLATERARRLRIWCGAGELHVDDQHGEQLGDWVGLAPIEIALDGGWVEIVT